MNKEKYTLSEGEEYIYQYLFEEDISFNVQEKIENLKGDKKQYRRADFYLNKFNIYIEFFGNWQTSEEHKERYREKRKVYEKNRIACIYIYPENLGVLDFTFHYRVKKELLKYGMKKEANRFCLYELIKKKKNAIGFIILAVLVLIFSDLITNSDDKVGIIISASFFIISQISRLIQGYLKIFNIPGTQFVLD